MKRFILMFLCCLLLKISTYAQSSVEGNKPWKNTSRLPLPAGPSVVGVFDGRCPCQEMARQLNITTTPDCVKIKFRLLLRKDSLTHSPSTYKLVGSVYRKTPREGKWTIAHGTTDDPNAIVYVLDPDKPSQSIYILKGDDNVLFFLDRDKKLMPGNGDFSYTLNRAGA